MTNEKAVAVLQHLYENAEDGARQSSNAVLYEEDMEALDIAIKALSAEPLKRGRWSKMFLYKADDGFQHSGRECSECGSIERPLTRHKFCPNCGARMDGDDNA